MRCDRRLNGRRGRFGPDRRRNTTSNYIGPERRKGGKADVIRQTPLLDKARAPV